MKRRAWFLKAYVVNEITNIAETEVSKTIKLEFPQTAQEVWPQPRASRAMDILIDKREALRSPTMGPSRPSHTNPREKKPCRNSKPPAVMTNMGIVSKALSMALLTHILQSFANSYKATDIIACLGCSKDTGNTDPKDHSWPNRSNQASLHNRNPGTSHATRQGPRPTRTAAAHYSRWGAGWNWYRGKIQKNTAQPTPDPKKHIRNTQAATTEGHGKNLRGDPSI